MPPNQKGSAVPVLHIATALILGHNSFSIGFGHVLISVRRLVGCANDANSITLKNWYTIKNISQEAATLTMFMYTLVYSFLPVI